jgi:hypothetical protein
MAEFYITYKGTAQVIRSVNVDKAIEKLIKEDKTVAVTDCICNKIIRKVYNLKLTGANKIDKNIKFETKVALKNKEFIPESTKKAMMDADVITSCEYHHIGYKLARDRWDDEGFTFLF